MKVSTAIDKFVPCLILFLCVFSMASGQRITMVRTLGGARFEMDTVTLSPQQVMRFMGSNPIAYQEFKKAKLNYSAAGVLGFSGGILVALPVVTAIAGGSPEWRLALLGGALVAITIPLNREFRHHAENALDEYNKKFTSRLKTNLYLTGAGAKIVFRF